MFLCVETTYPLFVKGAAAKTPAKNRKIKMEAVFLDRAQPIWNPYNNTGYNQV